MGKRGPKPKPTALMVFDGDPGHRLSQRKDEVAPPVGSHVPSAPESLGPHGRAKWDEVAPHLHAIGCLTSVDLGAFELYCDLHDEFHGAVEQLERDGLVLCSEKGGQYQHPALGIKSNARKQIRQFAADFGMTPAARVGLSLGDANKQDDELEALKKGTA